MERGRWEDRPQEGAEWSVRCTFFYVFTVKVGEGEGNDEIDVYLKERIKIGISQRVPSEHISSREFFFLSF